MIKIFNSNSERLHGLDHLRALAIILVIIFHYGRGVPAWLEPVRNIGWTGVDLFFVLSGYLIGNQLLKEFKLRNSISFKRFYLKRFFRIIPAFIAVLILYYSIPNLREGSGMPPLWKLLTFTQNLGLDVLNNSSYSHVWSLCIEEQFYLLLPITIMIIFSLNFQKATVYIIISLVVLGFALRYFYWNDYVQPHIESGNNLEKVLGFFGKLYYPSYNRMDGLLVGLSIAAIFNFKPKIKCFFAAYGNLTLIAGLILLYISYKICNTIISFNTAIYGFPMVSIAFGFIVIAALSPSCVLYKFKTKATLIIATLSYAIYLTHKQIFISLKNGVENHGMDRESSWVFWIALILAGLGGLVLHLAVEKPFFKVRDRVLKKHILKTKNKRSRIEI